MAAKNEGITCGGDSPAVGRAAEMEGGGREPGMIPAEAQRSLERGVSLVGMETVVSPLLDARALVVNADAEAMFVITESSDEAAGVVSGVMEELRSQMLKIRTTVLRVVESKAVLGGASVVRVVRVSRARETLRRVAAVGGVSVVVIPASTLCARIVWTARTLADVGPIRVEF